MIFKVENQAIFLANIDFFAKIIIITDMKNIPKEALRQFLIGISKKHLDADASYEDAYYYIYLRPNGTKDVYERIIKLAFTTLARNNRGLSKNPNYNRIHNESQAFLTNSLKSISSSTQIEYDKWHKRTMEGLIDIFNKYDQFFTIGKAQKWINMSIKHLAIFSPDITHSYYNFAHIPVDSYIISGLKDKIDCTFGQNPKCYISWNNINDYDSYMRFQRDFRDFCGEAPLDAEFHLWMKERGLQY